MASQYREKKRSPRIRAAQVLARAFNTLNVEHLRECIAKDAVIDGDKENDRAEGADQVLSFLETSINRIGALHRPTIAEVARLEFAPKKYFVGVSIEIDDVIFLFLAVHTDKNGLIKVIYFHESNPSPSDAELSGDRPGFNLSKYESTKECLWAFRRDAVKRLSVGNRPHFVAVIHESQDPERILLVLDELTRNFDGSTCELLINSNYAIGNTDATGHFLNFVPAYEKAVSEMGSVGFPTLGVLLNGECIRPGYRSWNPDEVTADLVKMGISKTASFKEQVLSVN